MCVVGIRIGGAAPRLGESDQAGLVPEMRSFRQYWPFPEPVGRRQLTGSPRQFEVVFIWLGKHPEFESDSPETRRWVQMGPDGGQ